jgi:hypothetical protein
MSQVKRIVISSQSEIGIGLYELNLKITIYSICYTNQMHIISYIWLLNT